MAASSHQCCGDDGYDDDSKRSGQLQSPSVTYFHYHGHYVCYNHCNKPVPSSLFSSHRMFVTFPGTKTYFSHLDISARSSHLLSHGKKIVLAIAEGAKDISQLTVTLAPLQTLHAYRLRIDPTNFKVPVQKYFL